MSEKTTIDTGDHVYHEPSGEDWIVAYVENGRLAPCGWPSCLAELSDCQLLNKASPQSRLEVLNEMASMKGSDHRAVYAISLVA